MADWSLPVNATAYANVLSNISDRLVDAASLFVNPAPTNTPTGAIRYLRASDKFQEWSGAAWVDKVLAIAGGGTGGTSAASARTALGLGTMAVQNDSAVNITGGNVVASLTGCSNIPAAGLTGTIAQARLGSGSAGAGNKYLADDQTYKALNSSFPLFGANQSADFTAVIETSYALTGTHTVTLPSVVANGSKRVFLINAGTGSWTIAAAGGETIIGSATYSFNFGQYSSITLVADANNSRWDIA